MCFEELCYVLSLSEPSEGLGADGLLGRAPWEQREGREREIEKKQRPLQRGAVQKGLAEKAGCPVPAQS